MKLLNDIKNGFKRTKFFLKYITFMYAVTFIFSFFGGLAFNLSLNPVKNRPILNTLFEKFNFSIYNSFMHNYGDGIDVLMTSMFLFAVMFVLIEIFFSSALLGTIFDNSTKNKISRFFSRGVKFYWRFFKLFIYFLIAVVVAFAAIVTITAAIISSYEGSGIESDYFYTTLIAILIFILAFIKLSIIADVAKLFIVKENIKNVWFAVKKSFLFLLLRMHVFFFFYFIIIFIVSAVAGIYLLIETNIITTNMFAVFVLFIIQQLIIWVKYASKVLLIALEYEYFNLNFVDLKTKDVKK